MAAMYAPHKPSINPRNTKPITHNQTPLVAGARAMQNRPLNFRALPKSIAPPDSIAGLEKVGRESNNQSRSPPRSGERIKPWRELGVNDQPATKSRRDRRITPAQTTDERPIRSVPKSRPIHP